MLFADAKREEIGEKYPHLKMTEKAKILGEMWGKCSDEDKQPFKDENARLKEEFLKLYPKKKKPKKAKKKTPVKKKKKKPVSESENDSSSDEEPLAKKKKGDIQQQIKDSIIIILKDGDLDTLSVKKIRAQLKEKFGDNPVRENKSMIKEFINSELEKL